MRWVVALIGVACASAKDDGVADPDTPADADADADADTDADADADADTDADTDTGLPTGAACAADEACRSGHCWDFSDYDPYCGGTACTVTCGYDIDCETAFAAVGAPSPAGARCGVDGLCDPVATGLGSFYCE